MIRLYLNLALRNILKYKTQNIISVVGLAVGIFCFSLCIYTARLAETVDECYDNHKRIAALILYSQDENGREQFSPGYMDTPVMLGRDLKGKDLSCVEAVTSVVNTGEKYEYNLSGRIYGLTQLEVDSSYARVFTPDIAAGSWSVAASSPNSLIMSRTTAERMFGSIENAIGKSLISRNRKKGKSGVAYTIQAVMEDLPQNNRYFFMSRLDALALNDIEGYLRTGFNTHFINQNYVLLKKSASIDDLNEELDRVFPTYVPSYKEYDHEVDAEIITKVKDERRALFFTLGGMVGVVGVLILLVSFVNMFHFIVGSFFNRTKEFSIMKLLGGNRKRLSLLLFLECLIIVLCTAFLLLWLIEIFGSRLNLYIPLLDMYLQFETGLMYQHALQYVGITIAICVLIASSVAVYINRISVGVGVYGGGVKTGKQTWRNISMGIQFFICWIFISSTAAIYFQSRKVSDSIYSSLSAKEKQEIIKVPLVQGLSNRSERMAVIDQFRQITGVKDVMPAWSYVPSFLKDDKGNDHNVAVMAVPDNFFEFMNLSAEAGHLLDNEDDMVVDQGYAERWSYDGSPIGKTFGAGGRYYRVSGICEKFLVGANNRGCVFVKHSLGGAAEWCYVKCYPWKIEEVKEKIEGICRGFLPSGVESEVTTIKEEIQHMQPLEVVLLKVIRIFAIFCILITLLGVYSSITVETERRRKEVAIRKVCGAGVPQIMMLFGKLYIKLLAVTAVIAFPLMYALIHFFEGEYAEFFNYGILFWSGIFVSVALLTFGTIVFRILHIARINPAEVLKKE